LLIIFPSNNYQTIDGNKSKSLVLFFGEGDRVYFSQNMFLWVRNKGQEKERNFIQKIKQYKELIERHISQTLTHANLAITILWINFIFKLVIYIWFNSIFHNRYAHVMQSLTKRLYNQKVYTYVTNIISIILSICHDTQ
jgi:hypothetical protein